MVEARRRTTADWCPQAGGGGRVTSLPRVHNGAVDGARRRRCDVDGGAMLTGSSAGGSGRRRSAW
eukprot:3707610-Prymnesium_polylepis.1